MTRVVVDTNVIVSALLQPLGPSAQIFLLTISDVIQLCMSGPIYAEYEEVLRRTRFKFDQRILTATLQGIREKAYWVRPIESIRACSDPDDNIFLECASAADTQYLVTGNVKHFPPSWNGVNVVTPRRMLEIVSE